MAGIGNVLAGARRPAVGVGVGAAAVALASGALRALGADETVWALSLIVVVTAVALLGRGPALVTGLVATGAFSWFVTPPTGAFALGSGDDAAALLTFLVVSTVVSTLVTMVTRAREAQLATAGREAAAREAAATSDSRAAFFAAAGHNLRTPLASLKATAQTVALADAHLDDAERRELLDGLVEQVDRLTDVVDKALLLGRAPTGQALRREPGVDIAALARRAIGRIAGPGGADRSGWLVEAAPAPPGLLLDPAAVEETLFCLLDNARRHAPAGSVVRVRGRRTADGYELRVEDDGPGIPVDRRARVLEPFGSDRDEGPSASGLGLAIARTLTEAHGGRIAIESSGSGGAAIVLHLPGAP